ncbi:uridine kinase [Bacteroidales bacterium]|nr:uridine kinase [Bacteroidales bacterium]
MEDLIVIYCKNTQSYKDVKVGSSVLEIYESFGLKMPSLLCCAKVNNKTESLGFRCYRPKDIEFIDMSDASGMRTYVRSLCFVLSKAVWDLFPEVDINIQFPISRGYYCDLTGFVGNLGEEDIARIEDRMRFIIAQNFPFETYSDQTTSVVALFRSHKKEEKAQLLESVGNVYSSYNVLDGHIDHYYGDLLPSSGMLYLFKLEKYDEGLLLRVPSMDNPQVLQVLVKQDKMMRVFKEHLELNRVLGMMNVADLNLAHRAGTIPILIKVAEALQEKVIAKIAEEIAAKFSQGLRLILISGPSSSGKTTFFKRLQIQLLTNCIRPVGISLDDYFLDREHTPKDEAGNYDFESLYAIDLDLFNKDLKKILKGEKVALPTFDFLTGKRIYKGNEIELQDNTVLIMEGIHALNPAFLPDIDPDASYKIYVSALTSISLDNHNWIPTTDNRLIRRIIRDYNFRKYSAKETIDRWSSVRAGEDKWIFPFQENADAMFNSAMLYELAALRSFAEPILSEVMPCDAAYAEARRLLRFLSYFSHIDINELPNSSLLREFLGGSSFNY